MNRVQFSIFYSSVHSYLTTNLGLSIPWDLFLSDNITKIYTNCLQLHACYVPYLSLLPRFIDLKYVLSSTNCKISYYNFPILLLPVLSWALIFLQHYLVICFHFHGLGSLACYDSGLIPKLRISHIVERIPWMGDQPIARSLSIHDNTNPK